jgi:cation transport ATPase
VSAVITPLVLTGVGFMGWRRARSGTAQDAPGSAPGGANDGPARIGAAATSKADELAQHELAVERFARRSLVLLIGTTAGALLHPLFTVATVPFLAVHALPLFREGYQEIRDGKLGGGVVRALAGGGMLATRAFWVLSLSGVLSGYIDRLQIRARRRSQDRLAGVFGQLPRTAWLRRGDADTDVEVAAGEIAAGELVVVGAGQTVPVDGRIESGAASVDERALTGEAALAERTIGDRVLAATVVRSGRIAIRVERVAEGTAVARLEDAVHRAADHAGIAERQGEVIADRTVGPTLALAAVAQALLGSDASICALAVYPGHGMRMLGPLSALRYLRFAAERQIAVCNGRALEALAAIDTVVLDEAAAAVLARSAVVPIDGAADGDANHVVRALRARGLEVHVVPRPAAEVAARIRAWQRDGRRVCAVGDGRGGPIAQGAADASVSMAGIAAFAGAPGAGDVADAVLLDGDLAKLALVFDLARDLAVNLRHDLTALLAPSPLLAAGIFLLGFRTSATLLLTSAGALAATANATLVADQRLRALSSSPAEGRAPRTTSAADPEAQLAQSLGVAARTVERTVRRLLGAIDRRFGPTIAALGKTAQRVATSVATIDRPSDQLP